MTAGELAEWVLDQPGAAAMLHAWADLIAEPEPVGAAQIELEEMTLAQVNDWAMGHALRICGGSVVKAARWLDISRNNFYRWMRGRAEVKADESESVTVVGVPEDAAEP